MGLTNIEQRVKGGEESICKTCAHNKVCRYMDNQPCIECSQYAAPERHGRWIDRYGGKYANRLYVCSECKGKALYKVILDVLDKECIVQVLSATCPHCGAKMDKEAENGTAQA